MNAKLAEFAEMARTTEPLPPAKVFVVLPAYNEADNLRALLRGLETACQDLKRRGHQHQYIVVDDGSRDETPRILDELTATFPLTIITHHPNRGLGPTLRDGLEKASELADAHDIVFTMDADNSHPAELMAAMTAGVLLGSDVVIASRYRAGSEIHGLARHRQVLSTAARLLFEMLFPIRGVRDYTCGYRAYRAGMLQKAFLVYGTTFVEYQGFQAMPDILLKLSRLGARMTEVPMILRYDLKKGQSKMRLGRTVVDTLYLILRRRFERKR